MDQGTVFDIEDMRFAAKKQLECCKKEKKDELCMICPVLRICKKGGN